MADSSGCVFGNKCPQAKVRERRVVESVDKYRKETIETFDLCDGTLLNKITIIEGTSTNGEPWEHGKVEEKKVYDVSRKTGVGSRCSFGPTSEEMRNEKRIEEKVINVGRKGSRCSLPQETSIEEPWEFDKVEESKVFDGRKATSFPRFSLPKISTEYELWEEEVEEKPGRKVPKFSLSVMSTEGDLWQHEEKEERKPVDRKGTMARFSLPLIFRGDSWEYEKPEEKVSALSRHSSLLAPEPKSRISFVDLQQTNLFEQDFHDSIEVLIKENELEEMPFLASTPRLSFPMCDYRPPRPSSQSSHFSEKTLSFRDSLSKKSSLTPENRPPPLEIPIPAPRRFTLKVDERSLNASPKEPISRPVQEKNVPIRPSILSLPTEVLCHEEYQGEMAYRRSSPFPAIPDLLASQSRQSIGRASVRTSSRSSESHILRSHSVSNRQRVHEVRESPRILLSPQPMGDQPRSKGYKEIPIYRDSALGKYEKRRIPHLQEETVTKETFERVTTARRLLHGTPV